MLVFVAAFLSLSLANAALPSGGLNWIPFAVSKQVVITTDFSDQDIERFYVKMPCEDTVWFKLFLRRDDGANSHVEIYSRVKGNIYCNGAGAKNWYGGEKTDFTMTAGAMKCETGGKDLIIIVEKTADRVTIKNKGQTLYNQAFTDNDANCRKPTTQVKTQVWEYAGSLGLGVFDSSFSLGLAAEGSCFVQDFDYGQADIRRVGGIGSAEECLATCFKEPGCKSMAFVPGNGDCWLKNKLNGQNPKPKVGVISANPSDCLGKPSGSLSGLNVDHTISFKGIFSATATRFALNIKDKDGNYMFRLAFRLPTDPTGSGPITVMNSRVDGTWGTELRAPFPAFEDGKEFTLTVVCLEDRFVAYFNGQLMSGVDFPYRSDLGNAAAWELWGGNAMGDNGVPILYSKVEPVDGGLAENYGDWSACSVADGGVGGLDGGSQSRRKSCTNPAPCNGGAGCEGDAVESRACPGLSGLKWVPFTGTKQAVITIPSTDFSDQIMERFYVKMPCEDTVWFKLFLGGDDGANSHVEIYSRVKGNIYCNGAGSKNWWGGEKTDFTMDAGAMKCEAGDKSLIIIVEKTADRITIKNRGQTLYNQAFTDNDANCRKPTTQVKTQVWNYEGWLDLAVFDSSVPLSLGAQGSCFVQDFDYGQADIKKITKVDSAESCLNQCYKQPGCLSMAFVPGNGDCWLKNLLYGQNPKPKVGVVSANLVCQGDSSGTADGSGACVDQGVDYWGADIKNINPIYTIEECDALCYVADGCVSITHRPSTQDCWLKNKPNGANGKSFLDSVNSINTNCFLLLAMEDKCVKENYDFRGADIRMVPNVLNVRDCAALCADEAGCVSVTHQPSTSRCWLKNKEFGSEPQDMDGVSSMNMKCGDVWCKHAKSFLYTYADKPRVKYVDFEEAAKACVENDACKGITQEPYSDNKYTLRRGPTIHDWSPTNETSWTLCNPS